MAKTRFIQSSFVSGELSPLLKGRIDINQYYQAVETADNVVIVPQGGMRRRPGTEFIAQTTRNLVNWAYTGSMPNGGNPSVLESPTDSPTTSTTVAIGTTDDYVVIKADRGATNVAETEFVDIRQISLSTGTSTEFKVQYSADDVTYTDGGNVPLIGTNPQNFRIKIGVYARYWRLVRSGTTDLGSATVTAAAFTLMQETGVDSDCKLEDFSVEDNRHYLIEFTRDNIAIFRSQLVGFNIQTTRVADIKPTYDSSVDVSTVRTAQIENVMLVFGNFEPMRLVNLGTDSDWVIDNIPFLNVPQYDFDDAQSPTPVNEIQVMTLGHTGSGQWRKGDRFEIDIEGVLSKSISYVGDDDLDEQSATVFNIQKNLQEMPVFGETGVAVARTGADQYTITISGESTKNFELFSAYVTEGSADHEITFTKTQSGSPRKEDVWSNTRGWPRSACFYEGRLVIGGTQSKLQSIFMSKTGAFFDFDIDDGDDDEGIFATISSRKLNDIVDVYPGRNLQIFTSGAEFAVTSRPVTPSSINIQPQTSHGANNVEVQDVDGSTIFVDRHGKSLLSFLYSFNEDAYTTDDRSVLASHLINQPVDMALLAGTASDDANWLFIVNTDGTATILNTLRSQDINGFTRWNTSGDIKSVCVVDDQLFMTVERTVNSVAKLFIERWDFTYLMDCSIKSVQVAGVIDGLDHLNGESVKAITREGYLDKNEGYVLSSYTVASGEITLDASEVYSLTTYEVGLPFVPTIKPMPLNTNIGSGQNQMRLKKIVRMNVRVYESSGIYIDGIPVPIRSFGEAGITSPLTNESIVPTSGIIEDVYDINGWGREVIPTITCPDPTPMHIQMIEYEVEGN
mgnify:CR=1 FL=1|jgi:hypothetical protein